MRKRHLCQLTAVLTHSTLTEAQNCVLITKTKTTREACTRKHEKRLEARVRRHDQPPVPNTTGGKQWTGSGCHHECRHLWFRCTPFHKWSTWVLSIFFFRFWLFLHFSFFGAGVSFSIVLPDSPPPDFPRTLLRRRGFTRCPERPNVCCEEWNRAETTAIPRKTSEIVEKKVSGEKKTARSVGPHPDHPHPDRRHPDHRHPDHAHPDRPSPSSLPPTLQDPALRASTYFRFGRAWNPK